ncbi:MAG: gamma-glutamylcyclotransferase [Lewinellaceae bacterium]|nr:gamma-glutamylcyclotransferase [Lewinella sp.]MCB9280956.1 gamma-glutamylcyclotransferase [Lewinellaceae bacterium]
MDKNRKPAAEKLFVYGTIKDAEVQLCLFDAVPPTRPGVLEGFAVHINDQGYYFLMPMPGNPIQGLVLSLTPQQLANADAWEDVPYYTRKKYAVQVGGDVEECWVYNGNFQSFGLADLNRIADVDREKVLAEIRAILGK